MKTLKEKFTNSIDHVVDQIGGFERTPSFINLVSAYADRKFNINAAATTAAHNALIEALDEYEY